MSGRMTVSAILEIITAADIRAFAAGTLEREDHEDVETLIRCDERAYEVYVAALKSLGRNNALALTGPHPAQQRNFRSADYEEKVDED